MRLRKGQPGVELTREQFLERYREQFFDPRFSGIEAAVARVAEQAWENYRDHRKAPMTVKAGEGFADPEYDLSIEWLERSRRLQKIQREHSAAPNRLLIVNGSPRNEHTCPGEMSKSFRLTEIARDVAQAQNFEVDILDLSRATAEYGKQLHPCKGCVSTAMPLCHWPCSCYPHNSGGRVHDWMGDIYEQWVAAHGVIIITPVNWYQVPGVLKIMMDRLVCADGGNPDPTSTSGKDALKAKKIEQKGWDFPKHLKGRAFGVIVHGDTDGIEGTKAALVGWLNDMELVQAGRMATLGTYIGYYEDYSSSHDALDKDERTLKEVENVTLSVVREVLRIRQGILPVAEGLEPAIKK